jgi:hypothetical protein
MPPTTETPVSIPSTERHPTVPPVRPFYQHASHSGDNDVSYLSEGRGRFDGLRPTENLVSEPDPQPTARRSRTFSLKTRASSLDTNKDLGDKLRDTEDDQWRLAVRVIELEKRLLIAAEDMMMVRGQFQQYQAVASGAGIEFSISLPFSLEYDSPWKLTSVTINDPPTNRQEISDTVASALGTYANSVEMNDSDGRSRTLTPMEEVEGFLIDVEV